MVSAIIPIRKALNHPLAESLDTSRSKSKGILIDITDGDDSSGLLFMGFVLVGYGCGIYYLLPLSLLTLNLTLLLAILFGSLIGMIFGMVLLAFNF